MAKILRKSKSSPVPLGFPDSSVGKESLAMQETPVQFLGREIPWRRERLPTQVFWPGEFLAKSLTGLSDFHFHLDFSLTFESYTLKTTVRI